MELGVPTEGPGNNRQGGTFPWVLRKKRSLSVARDVGRLNEYHSGTLHVELPAMANADTRYPVTLVFQINKYFFGLIMSWCNF